MAEIRDNYSDVLFDGSIKEIKLENEYYCYERTLNDKTIRIYLNQGNDSHNIEGDFIETGVWRGGASIFMAGLNKFYNLHRKVYVADSFEGLPPPNSLYPQDASSYLHEWSILSVSLDEVKSNFNKYNLLEENVVFIKGFFETSLKNVNFDKISLLRLDGDMYSSTIEVLNEMYYKVSIGGYIIIDDYGCTAVSCKEAVDDFRRQHNITSELKKIDWTGVYWIKE